MRRSATLALPILCLITDRSAVSDENLVGTVVEAADGGVNMVQLRAKELPTRDLLALAVELRDALPTHVVLTINGRADIAFAAGASGVHLPSDGIPVAAARTVLSENAIVGQSIHGAGEAALYEATLRHEDRPDYLELGTIFPSHSHPGGSVVGTEEIAVATRGTAVPIIAVGGVTTDNVDRVLAAGASGVAVITAILGTPSPREAARRLANATREAWERHAIRQGVG